MQHRLVVTCYLLTVVISFIYIYTFLNRCIFIYIVHTQEVVLTLTIAVLTSGSVKMKASMRSREKTTNPWGEDREPVFSDLLVEKEIYTRHIYIYIQYIDHNARWHVVWYGEVWTIFFSKSNLHFSDAVQFGISNSNQCGFFPLKLEQDFIGWFSCKKPPSTNFVKHVFE